jgi:TonB family protein
LDLAANAGATRGLPRAKDPQLPSVDELSRRIRDEVGDVASAEVRLCVGSDGRVQDVRVLRGSSSRTFNEALVRDMTDWQFSEGSGATLLLPRSCGIAKVSYRVN